MYQRRWFAVVGVVALLLLSSPTVFAADTTSPVPAASAPAASPTPTPTPDLPPIAGSTGGPGEFEVVLALLGLSSLAALVFFAALFVRDRRARMADPPILKL
jgi:hypothetical protein